ncbi:hypothetical protein A3K86_10705 [Photobacterium jeanii]|uniref:Competence protein CoiA-like N-terminal domain-containing protein n=1 Tax=Photobacterium jeanii TaxID=858640 RepID=A0A178KHL0_9GAMM|nr:competence protein CoiA family protein [Photobacterium jeanii]OAN16485.1 hypothetical protein A3K86_10705 [Photobacterium jeanii]PST85999.1 competence protein CoiA [Photobacterium jeanii]
MINFQHIPFGLRESDGELVDVADVQRGMGCNCICPSCKTPLIARHGDVNQWHFAHASRSVYSKTKKDCDFSFYVSVRLMARQIFQEEMTIQLPQYKGIVSDYSSSGFCFAEEFIVSDKQSIQLSDVKIEASFNGISVDVVGNVGAFKFVIYLTHPNRHVPSELSCFKHPKYGVLKLSLESLITLYSENNHSKSSYKKLLKDFLANDLPSKEWLFHPRYEQSENHAKEVNRKKNTIFRVKT